MTLGTPDGPVAPVTAADLATHARVLLDVLAARGWTVATAESLTGGMVAATLVEVPGASRSLRGGVVAYATDVKGTVLGVDTDLLAAHGAVHPEVARQMARGARTMVGADVGLATTGVAGPDPQDGFSPGTVHVAVVTPETERVLTLELVGDRATVRSGACSAVLTLAADLVRAGGPAPLTADRGTPGGPGTL
ncbi:MAG TPA: CinA family protein [Cellulomonas sp.]